MSTQPSRILVVDDDRTNLAIMRDLLEDDYEVELASSGESCLEKMDGFDPALVLLDIMMTGMDGYETCQLAKGDG